MDDLPRGPALLALARDVLVNDLLPLLPQQRRLDALLVANCMAIAAREAEIDDRSRAEIIGELEKLIGPDFRSPSRSAGPSLSRIAGEDTSRSEARERAAELLRRFAGELRIGAFENSPEREAFARAILWRMTIARLRLANPRFLAANGFA
ncbi:MAG TPA: DUF6285 domain-containing protein [Stellaceae bacterium]|jgi:hypothetical protein